MDNKVKNAVLAYSIDNSDSCGSYVELSGAKFLSEEFAFDIWYKAVGLCTHLVSQKNGFSLGISTDTLIVRLPSGGRLSIKSDITKLPDGVWTNLYFGFDGKKIIIYINGYKFGSADCNEAIRSTEGVQVGVEFNGFVRGVRFYTKVISEEDYKTYLLAAAYDAKKMPEIAAFMDFTKENIPDLSGKGVVSAIHKNCALVDTVEVYRPSTGGFAHFADSAPFNIGAFESGEFSLYAKIYIRPAGHRRHIIAVNGTVGSSREIAVFADCADGTTSFTVSVQGKEYVFKTNLATYSWVDLIVCAKERELTTYINGEKQIAALDQECKRTDRGDFKIGGCTGSANMSCEHYIHTIAVFDKVLSSKDASDFLENHPFVFEDNLTALVDFSAGTADELVGQTEVFVDNDDLITAANTVDTIPDEPYQCRINYSATASEMKKWEAETVAEGVKIFADEGYGLVCTAAAAETAALTLFLAKSPAVLDRAAGFYTENVVTSQEFAQALGGIGKSASKVCFKGLGFGSAGGAAVDTAAVMAAFSAVFSKMQELFYATLAVVGAGALAAVAAVAAEAIMHSRKEKPDDDDDKDARLALSSLTMQVSPDDYTASAVRCRNYKGVISGEEWTNAEKCRNPAVYIADQLKKAKIKVRFKIQGDSGSTDLHTVSLSASVCSGTNKIFDNFSYEKSGLSAGKEYDAELESQSACSAAKDFAHENIELWWSARVDGKPVALPNTKVEVYMIPTVPAPPILLDGSWESALPAVEYFKIITQMLPGRNSDKSHVLHRAAAANMQTGSDELKQMTNDLFSSRCFTYVGAPNFEYTVISALTVDNVTVGAKVEFNETRFLRDIAEYEAEGPKDIPIECEVYASILCYMFRLKNIQCRIEFVRNPLPDNGYQLKVVNAYSAGSFTGPAEHDFDYHVIVEVAPQPAVTGLNYCAVYDASLGIMQNGRIEPVAGVPFYGIASTRVNCAAENNAYRGKIFADNSGAVILSESYVFVPLKNWPY